MMDRTSTILAVIELDSILLRIDRFIFVLKQVYALLETSPLCRPTTNIKVWFKAISQQLCLKQGVKHQNSTVCVTGLPMPDTVGTDNGVNTWVGVYE